MGCKIPGYFRDVDAIPATGLIVAPPCGMSPARDSSQRSGSELSMNTIRMFDGVRREVSVPGSTGHKANRLDLLLLRAGIAVAAIEVKLLSVSDHSS